MLIKNLMYIGIVGVTPWVPYLLGQLKISAPKSSTEAELVVVDDMS